MLDHDALRARLDAAPTREAVREFLVALSVKDLRGLTRFCDLWIQPGSVKADLVERLVQGTTGAPLDEAARVAQNARIAAEGARIRAEGATRGQDR